MKKNLLRMLAALLAISLVAAACGDDDPIEDASSADEADAAADEMTEDDMAEEEAAEDPGTIVDIAAGNEAFSTLVAAVIAADLVDTLNSEGPFTVFAPTDEAFAAALDALGITAEDLLADTDLLTAVLTYHVVAGAVPAADVVTLDGQNVATVNGAEVAIAVNDGTVMVNDATVVTTDIMASNGIIHVIDTVLLP